MSVTLSCYLTLPVRKTTPNIWHSKTYYDDGHIHSVTFTFTSLPNMLQHIDRMDTKKVFHCFRSHSHTRTHTRTYTHTRSPFVSNCFQFAFSFNSETNRNVNDNTHVQWEGNKKLKWVRERERKQKMSFLEQAHLFLSFTTIPFNILLIIRQSW